jgi:hypothetical protein
LDCFGVQHVLSSTLSPCSTRTKFLLIKHHKASTVPSTADPYWFLSTELYLRNDSAAGLGTLVIPTLYNPLCIHNPPPFTPLFSVPWIPCLCQQCFACLSSVLMQSGQSVQNREGSGSVKYCPTKKSIKFTLYGWWKYINAMSILVHIRTSENLCNSVEPFKVLRWKCRS